MNQLTNTTVAQYDQKLLCITAGNLMGDKAEIKLPVKAVKRLLRSVRNMPVPINGMKDGEMADLLEAIADCLEEEMTGEVLSMHTAEGVDVNVTIG